MHIMFKIKLIHSNMVSFTILLLLMFNMESVYLQQKALEQCKNYLKFVNLTFDGEGNIVYPTILGGTNASLSQFPHMASIGYEGLHKNLVWSYGGSLISDYFVLTAASVAIDAPPLYVRLGTTRIREPLHKSNMEYRIAQVISHPNYSFPLLYNDIALLRLDDPVVFNYFIQPACLQTNNHYFGEPLLATGWGSQQKFKYDEPADLAYVEVVAINKTYCTRL